MNSKGKSFGPSPLFSKDKDDLKYFIKNYLRSITDLMLMISSIGVSRKKVIEQLEYIIKIFENEFEIRKDLCTKNENYNYMNFGKDLLEANLKVFRKYEKILLKNSDKLIKEK